MLHANLHAPVTASNASRVPRPRPKCSRELTSKDCSYKGNLHALNSAQAP